MGPPGLRLSHFVRALLPTPNPSPPHSCLGSNVTSSEKPSLTLLRPHPPCAQALPPLRRPLQAPFFPCLDAPVTLQKMRADRSASRTRPCTLGRLRPVHPRIAPFVTLAARSVAAE